MSHESLSDYEVELGVLDAILKPIGERKIDFGQLDWREWLNNRPDPLDEAGVRAEAESLLAKLTELYANTPSARAPIRELFKRHPSASWAMWPACEPTTDDHFRSRILRLSMDDQGRDARDALMKLWRDCRVAASAGVDIAPILEAVAFISSDENRFGMGSMRRMLREAPRVYMRRAASPCFEFTVTRAEIGELREALTQFAQAEGLSLSDIGGQLPPKRGHALLWLNLAQGRKFEIHVVGGESEGKMFVGMFDAGWDSGSKAVAVRLQQTLQERWPDIAPATSA